MHSNQNIALYKIMRIDYHLTIGSALDKKKKNNNLCDATWKTKFGNIFLQEFPPFNVLKEVPYRNRHTTKTSLSILVRILIPKH